VNEDQPTSTTRTRKWKTVRGLVVGAILLIVLSPFLAVGWNMAIGLLIMANPKFTPQHLNGLSSAQVIKELGQPDYDPRQLGIQWSEDKYGPLILSYQKGNAYCNISFKNDLVVGVERKWGD
jgi:hypothetical protein